jgi:exoribonuclease R
VPRRPVRPTPPILDRLAALRTELGVPPSFPPEVEAEAAAAAAPRLPRADLLDVPFVTVDPPGSRDLDQALHIERRGSGFRIRYAIADVAAFVTPGGAVDAEAHARGVTLYWPGGKAPLHPPVLSEGAASLLPDQERPALVWTLDLDADGELAATDLARARVRSRAKLDYATADIPLLEEVGRLRIRIEAERGGVHLPLPQQEVTEDLRLTYRSSLPIEEHNAQISLLTGMAAARLMLDGGVGILRTVPPASEGSLARLRRAAAALAVDWPAGLSYPDFIHGLDPAQPTHAALLHEATGVLRGAGYVAFDGPPPEQPGHSAIAAPYAHVTAPLRRLADRYALEVCAALCAGTAIPEWARAGLPELPEAMQAADRRAGSLERAVVDLVEAVVLEPCVGRTYDAVVVDDDRVQIADPAVVAPCDGDPPVGERIRVRLAEADPDSRRVRFEPV